MRNFCVIGKLILLCGALCCPTLANAGNVEPPSGLKQWSPPNETALPPLEKRKIVGTWYSRTLKCTRSFEQAEGKYFEVNRFSNKTGGNDGTELIKVSKNKFQKKSGARFGDYFLINADGSLGIYDQDGLVDTLPTHTGLWPSENNIAAAESIVRKPEIEDTPQRRNKIKSQFNSWDGAHSNLERFIKDGMNDPKSYEHVETSYVDMGTHLIVKTTFRGKNGFGALVRNTVAAKTSLDGEVLKIISQN